MAIEQLATEMAVEKSAGREMKKSIFEDSNRTSGLELPGENRKGKGEVSEGRFYSDSNREIPAGPQWKEAKNDLGEKKGLTREEKQEIKEKTGWSDEIINATSSMKEVKIYRNAGLQEAKIADKKCLIKDNIDMNLTDEDGISNRERMKRGRPALTKDGQEIELHHIGQKPDSSLAELTSREHRGVGNDTILHDKGKESEIDRNEFAKKRKNHWKFRAEEGVKNAENN